MEKVCGIYNQEKQIPDFYYAGIQIDEMYYRGVQVYQKNDIKLFYMQVDKTRGLPLTPSKEIFPGDVMEFFEQINIGSEEIPVYNCIQWSEHLSDVSILMWKEVGLNIYEDWTSCFNIIDPFDSSSQVRYISINHEAQLEGETQSIPRTGSYRLQLKGTLVNDQGKQIVLDRRIRCNFLEEQGGE